MIEGIVASSLDKDAKSEERSMGCTPSKSGTTRRSTEAYVSEIEEGAEADCDELDPHRSALTVEEIQLRIDASQASQTVRLSGVTMRYAYVSQRGFYPNGKY